MFTRNTIKEFTYIYDHLLLLQTKQVINNCGKTVT